MGNRCTASPDAHPSTNQLFNCPNPIRARCAYAANAPDGWYPATHDPLAPMHIVLHSPEQAKAVLDVLEPAGVIWKPSFKMGVMDRLLEHAATKATAENWPRQRQGVEAAIGQASTFSERFSDAASNAAVQLVEAVGLAEHEVDMKQIVENASCNAIVSAICGRSLAIEAALLRLWRLIRSPLDARGDSWQSDVQVAAGEFREAVERRMQELCCSQEAHGSESTKQLPMECLASNENLVSSEKCDNIHSFLIAGFEATNCLMLFCLMHLSRDGEIQGSIALEVSRRSALRGNFLIDDADNCPTLCSVVLETLRMYPPVLSLPRMILCPKGGPNQKPGRCNCSEGFIAAGLGLTGVPDVVPHGSRVTICTAACSRIAAEDGLGQDLEAPWQWKPCRPLAARSGMMPFGCGPRRCPGGQIALALVRVMIGMVCQSLQLRPASHSEGKDFGSVDPHADMEFECYEWEHRLRQLPTLYLAGKAVVHVSQRTAGTENCNLDVDKLQSASTTTAKRCCITIDSQTYDVTSYLEQHPGGAAILQRYSGEDASEEFSKLHTQAARLLLPRFLVRT